MKACPFCGGEARVTKFGNVFCVECMNVRCLCRTQLSGSEDRVKALWDNRFETNDASCPCCGGEAVHRVTQDSAQWHYLECSECNLRHLACVKRSDAIKKWKVRHG